MSCGLAIAAVLMLSDPQVALAAAQPHTAAVPASVAHEPLFADIVSRSGALKSVVDGWAAVQLGSKAEPEAGFFESGAFMTFKAQALDLSERDMQAHLVLKERGTDGDLKCIMRGISEDIPRKVAALEAAPASDRATALSELAYLLNDNVEVITSPPRPEV
mgnify:CR=1 FL=1